MGLELAGLHQPLRVPRGSGAALEGHPPFPRTREESAISWERKQAARGHLLQDEALAGVGTSWTSEKSLGSSIEGYLHCLRASQLLYPLDKKAGDP